MALLLDSDLEVDKVLIWNTEIPFECEVRQSSYFSLMGLEWCLRFYHQIPIPRAQCYNNSTSSNEWSTNIYHVVTLHQVIDGQVVTATEASIQPILNEKFNVKTFLKQATDDGIKRIGERETSFEKNSENIWSAGYFKDCIFRMLPCLYNSPKMNVKVVCMFYGKPVSTFRLDIGTGNLLSMNPGKIDKNVQVSSEVLLNFQTLSSDFSDLLDKEILPDTKLECEGQIIQVHRSVLAARSQVFRTMFQSRLLESQTGTVRIQDICVTTLQKLLKFIYSGKLEELSEDCTADLYEAADKYDIVSLKTSCSSWMIRNLNEGNYISYLQVADSHCDTELKAAVISFIVKNPSVLNSEAWLTFLKKSSELANEVFQAYIASTVR